MTGLDLERREVVMSSQRVPYDYLVLATGSHYNYFAHPEWASIAPALKTLQDALRIRAHLLLALEQAEMEEEPEARKALLTAVIVGAGPTGVELAGAIAELAHKTLVRDFRRINPSEMRVTLVEAGPRILAAFPERLASEAKNRLVHLGVEVRTNTKVSGISSEVVLLGEERVAAKTVLWAAGVAASPVAKWLHVKMDAAGRVNVQPDLTVPGHPVIYVIGDLAHVAVPGGRGLPGVAPVAMQQGSYVAKALLRRVRGEPPDKPFQYRDKGNLATVGRGYAIADLGRLKLTGMRAWLLWVALHIFYLIGFRSRVLVLVEWAWAYLTWDRGARLITEPLRGKQTP